MQNASTNSKKVYDLEERTSKFSEDVIDFAKGLNRDSVTRPLITQLVRASSSVGANYCEADCAESKKDFEHKMSICKKEAKEARYWLRLIARAVPESKMSARTLWREANELQLIFVTIVRNSKTKN